MSNLLGCAFDAPLIAISLRWPKTLHAVTMEQVIHGWKRGTFKSACGRKGLRLLGIGSEEKVAARWPPGLKGLAPYVRCRDCWEATGKKRPRTYRALGEEP